MSPATLSPPPTIEAPPIAPARPPAPPPELPVRAPLGGGRGREGGLRVTRAGLLVSLGIHALLAVVLIVGIDQVRRERSRRTAAGTAEKVSYLDVGEWPASTAGAPRAASAGTEAAAAQAVTAAAIDSALARVPELRHFPDHAPTRLPPVPGNGAPTPRIPSTGTASGAPSAQPGAANGTGAAAGIGGDAAAGPLGTGYGDRRLVVTPHAVPERQKSDEERYHDYLGGQLQAYNDSVADEAARQRRIHNWTFKDKNGREWGIGAGGVPIIAGHKIPVPIAPPIYQGRDRENAERTEARERAEINRQADDVAIDRNFHDRARATRQRVDEERRKRHEQQGDGSPPSSPPPSSGSSQ